MCPRDDQNLKDHFQYCQKLAQRLDIAKIGIALRDPDEFRASSSACAGPSSLPSKSDSFGQVLDTVQDMMWGFHKNIEHMSLDSEVKLRQELERENALLRARIEQQKEKYEVEIGYLLSVVRNNHSEDMSNRTKLVDAREQERLQRQASEDLQAAQEEMEKLRQELVEQRDAVKIMEERAVNAEKAKEETLKLFSASHQELKWMSAWLAQGEQKQELLRQENTELRRRLEPHEGSLSPQDGAANGHPATGEFPLDTAVDDSSLTVGNTGSYLLQGGQQHEAWEDLKT